MKRVLFVDDEPEELESLRRTLAPQEGQWEMAFAPGGDAALSLLAATPFDVVVTDVRMAGMDGAALLQAVCDRYPAIVRIVLSNQQELEAARRAIPVAHQFLVKPCDPSMLRVGIERATSLSDILSSKMLASLVGSVKDLPVMPRTYLLLRERLADPDVALKDVVKLVEQDVSISAKILQLVNSAFFGLPREVSTLRTAVSFLGIEMVQNLVLSAEVFRVFEKVASLPGFSFEELQLHSQTVAKIAARIPAPGPAHSAAIVAGLLHDVGKLVLMTRSPKHFANALKTARDEGRPLFEMEESLMGVSHAEVGAYLLGIWGLPCLVVEAVAHHHRPRRIPQDFLDAIGIIHVSNCLAHELSPQSAATPSLAHQSVDEEYLESIGSKDEWPNWKKLAEDAIAELKAEGNPAPSARPVSSH